MLIDRKNYWETVYKTKEPCEVSWTQNVPETSLKLIDDFNLTKDAKIIDVGGGDSKLVDFLLAKGYTNITVLDISETALEKAKKRLGDKASLVNWVISDVTEFNPTSTFDVWHDRATFHFLTDKKQVKNYLKIVTKCVSKHLVIGTFSKNGPKKCSGLEIRQYNEEGLSTEFETSFNKVNCFTENHTTPFNTTQNFIFCSFVKHS